MCEQRSLKHNAIHWEIVSVKKSFRKHNAIHWEIVSVKKSFRFPVSALKVSEKYIFFIPSHSRKNDYTFTEIFFNINFSFPKIYILLQDTSSHGMKLDLVHSAQYISDFFIPAMQKSHSTNSNSHSVFFIHSRFTLHDDPP